MGAAVTGCARRQDHPAANSSAQQRQSQKLSPSPKKTLRMVSRSNLAISCPRILDANTSLAESGSWHGSCSSTEEACSKQKRALDDVNSLLDKILLRSIAPSGQL